MKRGIVLLGLVWIMVGCSLPGRLQPVDPAALVGRPFTSEIQLTWDGEEYTGEFSRDEQGGIQLCLTGEYLETPLCFSSGPLGCTMTQGDLSVTFAARDLPAASLVASIERAFVMLGQAQVREGEEGLLLQAGRVMLCCGEGMSYQSLSLERGEMIFCSMSFSDG